MILAAGLTPAWQQILVFDEFQTGRVNRAREVVWCASGKVSNVALAVHHLHSPVRVMTIVGGQSGEAIQHEFRQHGIAARWIESAAPTRVCTTILDARQRMTTELVENAALAAPAELDAFQREFAEEAAGAAVVVLSGSLPSQTPTCFYRDLLNRTPARAVLDIRGTELLEALDTSPWLIKPNRQELAQTVGRPLNTDDELIGAMRELNRRGAEWVVVTQGADAVWVTSGKDAFRLSPPESEVVNPIGCGDAMAGGIAAAAAWGFSPLDCVKWGMAAAVDNLGQTLPCRLDRGRVEALAGTIRQDTL